MEKFLKQVNNKLFFKLFLFFNLPSAFWSGLRLEFASKEKSTASIPYKRFTKNPFRSTYFACLAMAAEMSTGVLAMMAVKSNAQKVSMLVVKAEAEFTKKVTERAYFSCSDGDQFFKAVSDCISTSQSAIVKAESIGTLKDGTVVARFFITWSFKAKE